VKKTGKTAQQKHWSAQANHMGRHTLQN